MSDMPMSVNTQLTPQEIKANEQMASAFNQRLKEQKEQVNHALGQTDFFRILSAQLANQDPLNPMEDKEFIAQMAQFSSLEEMKNMATGMKQLNETVKLSRFSTAVSLIGKEASVSTPYGQVSGTITGVSGSDTPMVRIGQNLYDISEIREIQ